MAPVTLGSDSASIGEISHIYIMSDRRLVSTFSWIPHVLIFLTATIAHEDPVRFGRVSGEVELLVDEKFAPQTNAYVY
jgi:hypothetical protein